MTIRRSTTSFLLAAVMLGVAALAAVGPSAALVYACSIGSFGTPERQRAAMLEALEGSDLVIVGVVLEERHVGTLANFIDKNDTYESSVKAEAVLAGDLSSDVVTVGQLDYHDSSCSGGPRLREGEKVLLALDRGFIRSDGAAEDKSVWRVHHFLGKVLIDEDEAVSQYASQSTEVGSPEALIRSYGETLGAGSDQVELAIAAAAGKTPPADGSASPAPSTSDSDSTGSRTVWVAVAAAALGFAVIAALFLRRHST